MRFAETAVSRRTMLTTLPAVLALGMTASPQAKRLVVYKTPWCGCCGGWVTHMRQAGWVVEVVERDDLAPVRAQRGIPDGLASCHTAIVGNYAIEGHVPASDINRLLRERPAALALSAPGMPAGSPGMESAGREPYVTLLLMRDGATRTFGRHNGA